MGVKVSKLNSPVPSHIAVRGSSAWCKYTEANGEVFFNDNLTKKGRDCYSKSKRAPPLVDVNNFNDVTAICFRRGSVTVRT
jgi:hypothetical protein